MRMVPIEQLNALRTAHSTLKGELKEVKAHRDRLIERLASAHNECQNLRERLRRALGEKSLFEVQEEGASAEEQALSDLQIAEIVKRTRQELADSDGKIPSHLVGGRKSG